MRRNLVHLTKKLSPKDFSDQFIVPRRPCIIDGLQTEWLAHKNWREPIFSQRYGESYFSCGVEDDTGKDIIMKLKDYLLYCNDWSGGARIQQNPRYLFDSTFEADCSELLDDYIVPPYFVDDVFSVVPDLLKPNYRWFIVGPALSGSALHMDPLKTSAWNALVVGKKKWLIVKPHGNSSSSSCSSLSSKYGSRDNLLKMFAEVPSRRSFDGSTERSTSMHQYILDSTLSTSESPVEFSLPSTGEEAVVFTQESGQTVFIPQGYMHAVLNVEFSVAITHNFLHPTTLLTADLKSVDASTVDAVMEEWAKGIGDEVRSQRSVLIDFIGGYIK